MDPLDVFLKNMEAKQVTNSPKPNNLPVKKRKYSNTKSAIQNFFYVSTKEIAEWSQLKLPEILLSNLQKLGFVHPLDLQKSEILSILKGNNFLLRSPVNSGKTLCYLISIFKHINMNLPNNEISSLILLPNSIIANQIFKLSYCVFKGTNIKSFLISKGTIPNKKIFKKQSDYQKLVIATPGKIQALVKRNKHFSDLLYNITIVVLDEADRLFDMGYQKQTLEICKRIRNDSQYVFACAT